MKKISLEEAQKLPYKQLKKLIDDAREFLKTDDVWKQTCKDYDQDVNIIDLIPIKFDNLDVTAKTMQGIIILNYKLLCDGDFFKDYSYIIHEGTHFLQQCFGEKPTQSADDGDYLSNPYEEEGFQNQINYISDHFGEDEAEDYVDHLLDHHDVKDKSEKEDKKEVLMSKV